MDFVSFFTFSPPGGTSTSLAHSGAGGALLMAEWNPGDSGLSLHPLAPCESSPLSSPLSRRGDGGGGFPRPPSREKSHRLVNLKKGVGT